MDKQDITVAGPGSPISLKKFLGTPKGIARKEFTFLIDGTGSGIAHDEEGMIYVTPEECSKQAIYYSENVFDGRRVPAYLYRDIAYMMKRVMQGKTDYVSDKELVNDFINGVITEQSPDYKYIANFIKYCKSNTEAQQVIGLIQIIRGTLSAAKKQNSGFRLYLDRPETALHPAEQSAFISWLIRVREEYGFSDSLPSV